MMSQGLVEVVSRYFVSGWAANNEHGPVFVQAECRGRILGLARAGLTRPDLQHNPNRLNAFIVVFPNAIAEEDLHDVRARVWGNTAYMPFASGVRYDPRRPCQVFILGSPRSGTSELGATISAQLGLPWLGEGHAAPAFATAAAALKGDATSTDHLVRFMAEQSSADFVREAAREAYYFMHGSASFLDKTPGMHMIEAAPFLNWCFPTSRMIFLRRNGISNVLSRMAKFGGNFEEHCSDWAAAMDTWEAVRTKLPHYLEIEQEQMLHEPDVVAQSIALYLGCPEVTDGIANSLRTGRRERTGAGIGKVTLAETGWSGEQKRQFSNICGPAMERWEYKSG